MALLPVETALARILDGVKPMPSEIVPLKQAYGRVTAKPVSAKRDQPPFDASAMDGYAVRSGDLRTVPVDLKLVGTSAAGHAFRGKVKHQEAVRILTGAPLPAGADAIVIQENTELNEKSVRILQPAVPGKNIRRRGLDFTKNTVLLPANIKLNSRDIGLAAAGGNGSLAVRHKPRVVLLTTGDELVLPGEKPRADQIVSSNSFALEAMLCAAGAQVTNLGIVKDSLKSTESAIRKGLAADLLVTTGGASVGDHDFVQQALKNCGVKIDFWKIALRPGKPLMFGTKARCRIIGLPGNPVSALVCTRIFIAPLIDSMLGLAPQPAQYLARLATPMPTNDNRKDYVRATLSINDDGTREVTPFSIQDSSMQRTLRESDCLVIREPFAPEAKAGDNVQIIPLDF
jgi:molybdopterin molybdotransferase